MEKIRTLLSDAAIYLEYASKQFQNDNIPHNLADLQLSDKNIHPILR